MTVHWCSADHTISITHMRYCIAVSPKSQSHARLQTRGKSKIEDAQRAAERR